jgi:hypothetical protein
MNAEKLMSWYDQQKHTHPEITDPLLRKIFANELLIIRRVCRQTKVSPFSEMMSDQRMGFETALRRVEAVQKHGLETVYKQNFTSP